MTAVLFDVGGTWIRAAMLRPDGPTSSVRRPTPATSTDLVREVVQMARELVSADGCCLSGVYVSIPGTVDSETGLVLSAGNVNVSGVHLGAELELELGVPSLVVNDTNAQAMALSPSSPSPLLYVAIGSGVGGAMVDGGRLVAGAGFAGEIGHLQVAARSELSASRCYCGRSRCLEMFTSGIALERQLGETWWEREDPPTVGVLKEATHLLADAVDAARVLLDPRAIHVASFLCRYDVVIATLTERIREPVFPRKDVTLTTSTDPSQLALKGLARLVHR